MENPGPIIQVFATPSWGGGEQFVYDLSRRLMADGRCVVLVSRPSAVIGQRVAALGAPYHTLPMKGVADMLSALMFAHLIVKYRPDTIHVHHFKDAFTAAYACLLCRAFGIRTRIVLTRHLVKPGKRGWIYRWLYGQIDRIAFVSELARREFLAGKPVVDPAKLCVIPNSVPEIGGKTLAGDLPDLRRQYGIASNVPLLLFCGRLVPEKGCDVLLEACARLKTLPFALVLAGTGEKNFEKRLHDMAAEQELLGKVFFAGFVRGANRLLSQADISVSPSVCSEAGSLTVLEAMQAGCAQVASDNGSQPEFIDNGTTGLLVPPADEERLAEALRRLLADDDLRRRMGRAAKECFDRHFSYERFYVRYLELYEQPFRTPSANGQE